MKIHEKFVTKKATNRRQADYLLERKRRTSFDIGGQEAIAAQRPTSVSLRLLTGALAPVASLSDVPSLNN